MHLVSGVCVCVVLLAARGVPVVQKNFVTLNSAWHVCVPGTW